MNKLKKNDDVMVISGKNKGKITKIKEVIIKDKKVVLDKVNVVKKHTKPNNKSVGGIIEVEKAIDWSKVMVVCKYCKKTTKIQIECKDNKRYRKCKKCNEILDKK